MSVVSLTRRPSLVTLDSSHCIYVQRYHRHLLTDLIINYVSQIVDPGPSF